MTPRATVGAGRASREGEGVEVEQRETGVVAEHLLVVRHRPVAARGVPKEPLLDTVAHLSGCHGVERVQDHGEQTIVVAADPGGQQQAERLRLRELGFGPQAAVQRVVQRGHGAADRGGPAASTTTGASTRPGAASASVRGARRRVRRMRRPGLFRDGSGCGGGIGCGSGRCAGMFGVVLAHPCEQREEPVGRQVGGAGQQLAGRREKGDRRPASHVVAPIDVGSAVVVDPHGDEALGDRGDDPRVRVARLVHDVAPVAPHRRDGQQHRSAGRAGFGERLVGPGAPGDLVGAVGPRRESEVAAGTVGVGPRCRSRSWLKVLPALRRQPKRCPGTLSQCSIESL